MKTTFLGKTPKKQTHKNSITRFCILLMLITSCAGTPGSQQNEGYDVPRVLSQGEKIDIIPQVGYGLLNAVWTGDFTPDMHYLLAGGSDNALRVWDLATEQQIQTVYYNNAVTAVCGLQDSRSAIVLAGEQLYIQDIFTGAILRDLNVQQPSAVKLTRDRSKALIIAGPTSNPHLLRLDIISGEKKTFSIPWEFYLYGLDSGQLLDISDNGKRGLVADQSGTLGFWDLEKGRLLRKVDTSDVLNRIGQTCLDFSGKYAAAWDSRNKSRFGIWDMGYGIWDMGYGIWDMESGALLEEGDNYKAVRPVDFQSALLMEGYSHGSSPDGEHYLLLNKNYNGTYSKLQILTVANMTEISIKADIDPVKLVTVLGSEDQYYVSQGYYQISIRDARTGKILHHAGTGSSGITDFDSGEDPRAMMIGNNIVYKSGYRDYTFFNVDTGEVFSAEKNVPESVWTSLHSEPYTAWTLPAGKNAEDYDLEEISRREELYYLLAGGNLAPEENKVSSVAISPDGRRGLTVLTTPDYKDELKVWDLVKQRTIHSIKSEYGIRNVQFSPDGKYYLYIDVNKIRIGKSDNGAELKPIRMPAGNHFTSARFSRDGSLIASGSSAGEISIWATESGRLLQTLPGNVVDTFDFSSDNKYLLTGAHDGITRQIELETGRWVNFLTHKNGREWLTYTDEGYWDSSPGGGSLVAMAKGEENWNIDQFASWNNRPDLILSLLPNADSALQEHYARQNARRFEKLNIDAESVMTDLPFPEAEITGTEQSGKQLTITGSFADENYDLVSWNIFINDVPLWGENRPIKGKSTDFSGIVELASGRNKIEVSCVNAMGLESFRPVFHAEYDEEVTGDLYYMGFGVSSYADESLILNYAHKDALDLGEYFESLSATGEYKDIHIHTWTDEKVTRDAITKAKNILLNASVDDTVVLFIAGHGVYDNEADRTYYYLVHDSDLSQLSETAADFEQIEDILAGIPPRNKLFLMDTCESGEIDPEVKTTALTLAGSRGISARSIESRGLKRNETPQAGVSKVYYPADRDSYIYNDLRRRTGAIVFSSSRGNEYSYESDTIENGFFTHNILKVLKYSFNDLDENGKISTDELRNLVSNGVASDTGGMQHPVVDRDNIYQTFGFVPGNILEFISVEGGSLTPERGRNQLSPKIDPVMVDDFLLSKYEVTRKLYKDIMGKQNERTSMDAYRMPVDNISFLDAVRFCNVLSEQDGLEPVYTIGNENTPEIHWDREKNGYRLPTEAEWEFAAAVDGKDVYSDRIKDAYLEEYAWYRETSDGPREIGTKKANMLGLYDMLGNVPELCWTSYRERRSSLYQKDPLMVDTEHATVNTSGTARGLVQYSRIFYTKDLGIDNRKPAGSVSPYFGLRLARNK